mmetsp:Transcript_21409/g.36513  ORF Transcript_21409/g.36513 Transcript_21409/m.36513 type:complete len:444 (-) Transcript_21409:341-1672(-)
MAASLKCGQCGVLLPSVNAAQTHSEVTGHTQFEESVEIIKVLKCVDCGKPCRSDAERMLHTRHTQHTQYVEATNEGTILNTEVQMEEARADMHDDAELLKSQLGVGKASSAKAATGGEKDSVAGSSSGQHMVAPVVDEALVAELESMGFGRDRAVRAIYHTGGAGVEAAANWVVDHEGDADIDQPLLVSQASEDAASKLTPEERKRKATDLIKSIKEKREKEEKELAHERERERIRSGKEILAAKKKEDDLSLKRVVDSRKQEKEEEAKARAKINARLEEDRRERRRKLGLPEELTDEEKAKDAERTAAKLKAETDRKKVFSHVPPVTALSNMRGVLVGMKKAHVHEEARWRTAATTLSKYLGNIANNPEEDKFRTIKVTNAAFQERVAPITGSFEFLALAGFQKSEDGQALTISREKLNMELLQGAGAALADMLSNPFFGAM